jgi:hypothetical protein
LERQLEQNTWSGLWRTKGNRHRLVILLTAGLFSQWSGNGKFVHVNHTNLADCLIRFGFVLYDHNPQGYWYPRLKNTVDNKWHSTDCQLYHCSDDVLLRRQGWSKEPVSDFY